MGIAEKNNVERDRQRTALVCSIERAQRMVEAMNPIGERESERIQEFIAYNIPRCNALFMERQQFRSILRELSYGRTEKSQAVENLSQLKSSLLEENPIIEGAQ